MIAKVIIGREFHKVLDYVHQKEGAYQIGGNMAGKDPISLAAEFRVSSALRVSLSRCVWHTTISTAPEENLSDQQWQAIAKDYLSEMNFTDQQYVVYKHSDTQHHHIHIIASRISLIDAQVVSDSWSKRRSEIAMRKLEQKYGLTAVESSFQKQIRCPKTGEVRQARRTGKPIRREVLQAKIEKVLAYCKTPEQLYQELAREGVEVRLRKEKGRISGISFGINGRGFQGGQLGRKFSWSNLQRAIEENHNQVDTEVKRKLRARYKSLVKQVKLQASIESTDLRVALKILTEGETIDRVCAILSQSDRVVSLKKEKNYQQLTTSYISKISKMAQNLIKLDKQEEIDFS